jgi:uncharacterized membrane protein
MPYEWTTAPQGPTLRLWPHRSLPPQGFVLFIGATSALIALPLLVLLGSPVLWGLLPFVVIAVSAMYIALRRSYRDAEILEELVFDPTELRLERTGPRGRRHNWAANPHWVRVELHRKGGPVPNYLTLRGGPREVELGAFLVEEERLTLRKELEAALSDLR